MGACVGSWEKRFRKKLLMIVDRVVQMRHRETIAAGCRNRESRRNKEERVWGDANRRIGDWERLGALTLSLLHLNYLLMVRCSEFLKPGVRIGV
jgi:hypothetical protein